MATFDNLKELEEQIFRLHKILIVHINNMDWYPVYGEPDYYISPILFKHVVSDKYKDLKLWLAWDTITYADLQVEIKEKTRDLINDPIWCYDILIIRQGNRPEAPRPHRFITELPSYEEFLKGRKYEFI